MVLKTSVEQPHSPGTECPSACFRMQIWMNFKSADIDFNTNFQFLLSKLSIRIKIKMAGHCAGHSALLEVLLVDLEIGLRMLAYRAFERCLGADYDMTAVAAFPYLDL